MYLISHSTYHQPVLNTDVIYERTGYIPIQLIYERPMFRQTIYGFMWYLKYRVVDVGPRVTYINT